MKHFVKLLIIQKELAIANLSLINMNARLKFLTHGFFYMPKMNVRKPGRIVNVRE